ncbi:alpha/beta hydrolase [Tsukamurella sp. 8F]|uniref:alpha/beta hydrolase n=1 Tax=unclassified Tsukamurella TaxID=2633480 RepID=UPI0023B9C60E|nr:MULTISPECIES: alpha/beta hydrolase [unclassified Tsukamurella]MDF0532375.1 alpha/beta hydrolase [Tsukamurella sp. 8J]MDF0589383.1 alpha/beta hydrolase [Tsukamurella sp. 8F]
MITPTDVTFASSGMQLAAHLYTPESPADGPRPAIVIGHPMTGVKEQTSAVYASRLAEWGFITLAFDAAYQGASEGEPRALEDPFQRAEDFRNAVTFLSTRTDVDPERIGVLGICASGGYAPYAAQTDHRMKAVATVSAADATLFFRVPDPEGFARLVAASGAARTAEARGEAPRLVPVLPDRVDENTPAETAEFVDYYKTPRGAHPRSIGAFLLRSADQLEQFDAFADVAKIAPRPLLMIAGSEAGTKGFSEGAVAAVGDSAELFVIDGASHPALYDIEEYVAQAVARLGEFFTEHLGA